MREILFRGKTEKGEWCEGLPTRKKPFDTEINRIQLVDDYLENDFTELFLVKDVLPETVGQYAGRTDKNGKKIFEGDIVTGLFLHSRPVNGVTAFRDGSFGLLWDRAGAETFTPFTSMCNVEYEMIGNIHDNPELLNERR